MSETPSRESTAPTRMATDAGRALVAAFTAHDLGKYSLAQIRVGEVALLSTPGQRVGQIGQAQKRLSNRRQAEPDEDDSQRRRRQLPREQIGPASRGQVRIHRRVLLLRPQRRVDRPATCSRGRSRRDGATRGPHSRYPRARFRPPHVHDHPIDRRIATSSFGPPTITSASVALDVTRAGRVAVCQLSRRVRAADAVERTSGTLRK